MLLKGVTRLYPMSQGDEIAVSNTEACGSFAANRLAPRSGRSTNPGVPSVGPCLVSFNQSCAIRSTCGLP